MRSVFYVALVFAVLARSSTVAAFPHTDESQLLAVTSPDSATHTKRSLRAAGQEVVQSTGNGNGGIFKSTLTSINKVVHKPEIKLGGLIEKSKIAQAAKAFKNKATGKK
ncbi:hypothetical protein L914_21380 [Phytophthora nicotianae]|uniref:RxLR effector protein n=1 Tax=Phytophthora nicotianae TaxID=4792 RepID=W2M3K6_PHYNI|nr:hypothetical protein L914_21380 [Phytophthora nicotianae]